MIRRAAIAAALLLASTADAASVLKVYVVDEHWKADVKLFVAGSCAPSMPRVEYVDQFWKADLKVYVVDRRWQATMIACENPE